MTTQSARAAKDTHCLITGATSGIGEAAAHALAGAGMQLILVCRSASKGEALKKQLAQQYNASVTLLIGDLAKQAEVRRIARDFLALQRPLHVLINNAGVQNGERRMTEDGVEETFAVNHLAPFLLTHLLLDHIKSGAPARVVNVASSGYLMVKGLDFDDLNTATDYSAMKAYGRSKLANILFTRELAERLAGTNVTANCLHPGAVKTSMGDSMTGLGGFIWKIILATAAISPEEGAKTVVYLAGAPEVATTSGLYFEKCKPRQLKPYAQDDAAAQRLWDVSARLVGLS